MGEKKPRGDDLNALAFDIVQQATGQKHVEPSVKNPAAGALSRLGGLEGGKARAAKISRAKRSPIAKAAARKRWGIA